MNKGKKVHLELLRIIAVYLVILTHTGNRGYTYFTTLQPSWQYYASMTIPVLCQIAVPIFYMISGAVLMGKDESPGHILRYRLPRHVLVLVLASAMMYVYYGVRSESFVSIRDFIRSLYTKNIIIPYWFLYSYIGYLLVLPFIRRMVRGMKDREWNYLFGVYLLFQGIVPVAEYLFFNGRVNMNPSLDIRMVTTDVLVFPALGWYLENRRLSRRELLALWLGAVTAITVTVFMTHYKILMTGELEESQVGTFYKTMRLLPAAAVYSAVKMLPELPHRVKSAITVLGGCTFGVYLIEQILRESLYPLCDRLFNIIPPPAGTMIYAALVFFFCIPFVCAIKKTPFFKQLI